MKQKSRVRCPTWDSYLYVLVLVEEYSHSVFTVLLKKKADAAKEIMKIFDQVKNQLQGVIEKLRSDGGGEFASQEFKDYLACEGIQFTTSTADHPQHNGIAERMNRTIFQLVRALMVQSGSPPQLWGEAVKYATHIYNVTPHEIVDWATPHQIMYNSMFNPVKLKVWGCDAYPKKLNPSLSKIQEQVIKGVFIGYDATTSSYVTLVYDSQFGTTTQIKSRDVQFIETEFTQMKLLPKLYGDGDDLEFRFGLSDQKLDDHPSDNDYDDSKYNEMKYNEADVTDNTAPIGITTKADPTQLREFTDLNRTDPPVGTVAEEEPELITHKPPAGRVDDNRSVAPPPLKSVGTRYRTGPGRRISMRAVS